jgi:hypothetical protein
MLFIQYQTQSATLLPPYIAHKAAHLEVTSEVEGNMDWAGNTCMTWYAFIKQKFITEKGI